jgi:hypothetical protein
LSRGRSIEHHHTGCRATAAGDLFPRYEATHRYFPRRERRRYAGALINLGNSYSLPEPPTLAALNHVILHLPEFGLYDDPTVSSAAFGVLAPEGYDKPVVRVCATAATLGRTPATRPEDHTAHAVTSIRVPDLPPRSENSAPDKSVAERATVKPSGKRTTMLRKENQ